MEFSKLWELWQCHELELLYFLAQALNLISWTRRYGGTKWLVFFSSGVCKIFYLNIWIYQCEVWTILHNWSKFQDACTGQLCKGLWKAPSEKGSFEKYSAPDMTILIFMNPGPPLESRAIRVLQREKKFKGCLFFKDVKIIIF